MVESTGHPAASTLHSALGLAADEGNGFFGGDELFEAIAPFVEAGSSVSFYGEDGSIWQYCFDGKQCRNESPLLIWPENPKALKEGQSVYRLPFSIQGELEFRAASRKEAYMALGLFDSEKFLSHLLTLFEANGIGSYLRPDEMKKVEG